MVASECQEEKKVIPVPIITKGMGRSPGHPSPTSKGTCCFVSLFPAAAGAPIRPCLHFPSGLLYDLAAVKYFQVNSYINPKYFRSSESFLKPRKFSPYWNKGIFRTPGSGVKGL